MVCSKQGLGHPCSSVLGLFWGDWTWPHAFSSHGQASRHAACLGRFQLLRRSSLFLVVPVAVADRLTNMTVTLEEIWMFMTLPVRRVLFGREHSYLGCFDTDHRGAYTPLPRLHPFQTLHPFFTSRQSLSRNDRGPKRATISTYSLGRSQVQGSTREASASPETSNAATTRQCCEQSATRNHDSTTIRATERPRNGLQPNGRIRIPAEAMWPRGTPSREIAGHF